MRLFSLTIGTPSIRHEAKLRLQTVILYLRYDNLASFGSIIKAIFQKVKHRDCKENDYILIL